MTEPHYFSKLQSAFGFGQICPCPGLHKQAGRGSLEPQCATKNWAGKDGTGKLMVESDESCFQVRCHLHWHLVQTQPTQPTQLTQPAPAMQKAATCCIFFAKVACSCLAPGCRCGSLRTRWNRPSCRIMSWWCEGGEAWGNYMKLSDIFTTFSQHFPSSPCCSSCFQKIIQNLRAASGWSDQLCWRGLPSWGLWWPASFIDNDGPRAYWFGWPLHRADDQHKLLKKYMTRSCISPCW